MSAPTPPSAARSPSEHSSAGVPATLSPLRPFDTVLVANRGEIACRVMRTARRLGLRTVAVHSEPDANALHVREADEAIALGGTTAAESYLLVERIVAAARRTGAGAIHPGYGFLSENPALVDACEAAAIVFVGPSAASMRAMGLKDAAKRLMQEAGVPVVPGYHGEAQDVERLTAEAEAIGYPLLIKARAGGGGKGMRRVERPGDFAASLAAARREAAASFGDEAVLIEKLIAAPRHVEVQVFGDAHGEVVHLFERDCSLQRRHQKVLEEAPAPGMSEAVRAAMTGAAVRAARAIDYVGAGTIEFIADGRDGLREDGFWFMEMNTRLQVEHPVTEAVTGVDLVEWQLRIAAGEGLPLTQETIVLRGHAVEARLYAEDAAAGFLPATGRLERLAFPAGVRVDAGVVEGDEISAHYDPLLAKLVAHAGSRTAAFGQLAKALGDTRLLGTVTNREFLLALCRHRDVLGGGLDTALIEREFDRLAAPPPADERRAARAVAALLRAVSEPVDAATPSSGGGERSLAERLGPWQLWGDPRFRVELDGPGCEERASGGQRRGEAGGAQTESLLVRRRGRDEWIVEDADGELRIGLDTRAARRLPCVAVTIEGRRYRLSVATQPCGQGPLELQLDERVHRIGWPGSIPGGAAAADEADVLAPMPGRIVAVACVPGEAVELGQTLVTLEAMKMEHALRASRNGTVAHVGVAPGDQVAQGDVLLSLDEGR